jgi:ribonuclease P protein component
MEPRLNEQGFDASSRSFGYSFRLHYPWEYRNFFSKNEVFRLRECTIFRVPNAKGHFRLGITFKARGSSLDRNRTKRRIRESFRGLRHELGAFDYNIVIPGHRKLLFPYPQKLATCLREQLPELLKKAKTPGDRAPQ